MLNYDAVVIGGGPGGYECAIRLSQNGLKTALVEKDELGGTCLNRGCIPTKALLHSAEIYLNAKNAPVFGVSTGEVSFDYGVMVENSKKISARLRKGIAFLEKNHGVTVYKGSAIIKDRETVLLDTGEELKCGHLVIATGSSPARLPIPGADLPNVLDSTGLLNMMTCPRAIVIIGAGVIGIEFATLYSRLGIPVMVIEMLDRALGPFDKDITDFVEADLRKKGIKVILGARVKSIEEGLKVNYSLNSDGSEGCAEGEVVLIAGGRVPNSRDIGLEAAGVQTDRRGFVEVDGLCMTNVPEIYAIGDVNGKMMLAHAASAQGIMVADHIAGLPVKQINISHIPSCVYCDPEISMVGMTEAQARTDGRDVGTGSFPLNGNGRALTMGAATGFVKFVFDKATDKILGFHMTGPGATELASEIAAVMECGGTMRELCDTVHPHPSVSEALMEAARICRGCCVNAPKPRR